MSSCVACDEPLVITVPTDDEDEDAMTDIASEGNSYEVPDDVYLACACHFHWACLLESYELSKCPNCSQDIVSAPPASSSSSSNQPQQILVDLNNEGGMQSQIDIYPFLREESYLRAYPEERRCRAFLELCREGDHRAIVDLLNSSAEEEGETLKSPDEILRYQDTLGDGASGLHLAAANGHREVAWLLLLLASRLPELEFPALVYQEAAALGIMRQDQTGQVDIRSLKDAHGQTAEDIARETGVIWNGWIGNGRLAMP